MWSVRVAVHSSSTVFAKSDRCDSYNTAQLQIIHGPDQRNVPDEIPSTPQSRGRVSEISAQIQRTANTDLPSAGVPPAESPFNALGSTSHSQELEPRARPPVDESRPTLMDGYREAIVVDSDEEYSDDVDFWGLESPRHGGPLVLQDPVSSGSEDEDDSDEDMSDDDADDLGEDDEEDQMEVFGHR